VGENFLNAGDGLSIVALADVFKDRMDACRAILKEKVNHEIADDKCFIGFDAYKKVCELPDVDVVLIATPTIFHPEHVKYAIDKGKHVFCEKPACIDAVGFRTYMTAVRQAQANGLCIVTGTQRHHDRGYIESYKKVQEGYIGRITSANVYWNQGHFNFRRRAPKETDMEYMLRDFFSWNWLCGDHVIDQGVHNVDVFTWFSHLKPVRVIGMGSQLRRITGDIYDNFSADMEYEGGVHVHAMMRQIDNCDNRVAEIIQGTKGSWSSINGFVIRDLDGNEVWKYDREAAREQFKQHNAYVLEHMDLVNHIRSGKAINHAETTATSSMACIMARESAYTGKAYTWDEMTQSDLNLMPAELHLGNVDMSKYKAPLPGTSPKW
jgi:predicted dehydrogenase